MDYEQLRVKYQSLLEENAALKLEIHLLKHGAPSPLDETGGNKVSPTQSPSDNERKIRAYRVVTHSH